MQVSVTELERAPLLLRLADGLRVLVNPKGSCAWGVDFIHSFTTGLQETQAYVCSNPAFIKSSV